MTVLNRGRKRIFFWGGLLFSLISPCSSASSFFLEPKGRFSFGYNVGLVADTALVSRERYGGPFSDRYSSSGVRVESFPGLLASGLMEVQLTPVFSLGVELGYLRSKRVISYAFLEDPLLSSVSIYANALITPLFLKLSTALSPKTRLYLMTGVIFRYNYNSQEDLSEDMSSEVFKTRSLSWQYQVGVGLELYLGGVWVCPSIRIHLPLSEELLTETEESSKNPWTKSLTSFKTIGAFFMLTFQ